VVGKEQYVPLGCLFIIFSFSKDSVVVSKEQQNLSKLHTVLVRLYLKVVTTKIKTFINTAVETTR
jgi:hypothetical protein